MNILLVCKGNICRSPMAEHWLRAQVGKGRSITVRSRGTEVYNIGKGAHPLAIDVMEEVGCDLKGHVALRVTSEDLGWADVVMVMDDENARRLSELHPGEVQRIELRHLGEYGGGGESEIGDPYPGDRQAFEKCRDRIMSACEALVADCDEG